MNIYTREDQEPSPCVRYHRCAKCMDIPHCTSLGVPVPLDLDKQILVRSESLVVTPPRFKHHSAAQWSPSQTFPCNSPTPCLSGSPTGRRASLVRLSLWSTEIVTHSRWVRTDLWMGLVGWMGCHHRVARLENKLASLRCRSMVSHLILASDMI